jgi:two-component system, NarL family, response regulator DegU
VVVDSSHSWQNLFWGSAASALILKSFYRLSFLADIGRILAQSPPACAPGKHGEEGKLERVRVIVADDSLPFLQELCSLLATEFDVVAAAGDGKSALDLVRQHKPDLVVLDIQMPKLNGIEVTRKLGAFAQSTPVVICSVETDPETVEAALEAGALAYVVKARIETDLILAAKSVLQNQVFLSQAINNNHCEYERVLLN